MALAKMAGFDVTPPRPSWSTIRCSSPPLMRVARMKSSQTDWPYCASEASGFTAVGLTLVPITTPSTRAIRPRLLTVAFLDGEDLGQAPGVALLGGVARLDVGLHQLVGDGGADDPAAQHQDVHVVVLDPLMGRVDVVADGGADARHLVGGHAGADTAATDEDRALGASLLDGESDLLRVVRIVDG